MATIRKRRDRSNRYQVLIRHRGFPTKSKLFVNLRDARQWAREQEALSDQRVLKYKPREKVTLKTLVKRYLNEVSRYKKGFDRETSVLNYFLRNIDFGDYNIHDVTSEHFAKWRDKRLTEVKAGTCARQLDVLRHIYSVAVKEWNLEIQNVVALIRRPRFDNRRYRILSDNEYDLILKNANSKLRPIIELAYETALRRGEILNIRREHLKGFCLDVPRQKTERRRIPLTFRAVEILKSIDLPIKVDEDWVSHSFSKLIKRIDIPHITFHDLRSCATTRFARTLSPQELMVVTGHRSMGTLSRYTNIKAIDLVEKINFNQQGKMRRVK